MIRMKNKTLFKTNWLEIDQFKSWLTIAKDENKARCKLCKKDIKLSNIIKYIVRTSTSIPHSPGLWGRGGVVEPFLRRLI